MTSHSLPGILCGITVSFDHVCWNPGHVEQDFNVFSISVFMFIHYANSFASKVVSYAH